MIIWNRTENSTMYWNKKCLFVFKTKNLFKKNRFEICLTGDNFGHLFLFGESVPFHFGLFYYDQ